MTDSVSEICSFSSHPDHRVGRDSDSGSQAEDGEYANLETGVCGMSIGTKCDRSKENRISVEVFFLGNCIYYGCGGGKRV